jgi:hypothetical protein
MNDLYEGQRVDSEIGLWVNESISYHFHHKINININME